MTVLVRVGDFVRVRGRRWLVEDERPLGEGLGSLRLACIDDDAQRHLLGPSRITLLDGNLGGEEFQCAYTIDGFEEVEVWVRNLPRHPSSFWLPKSDGRFYPDFVAKLTDGRLMVVEYKGAHLVGAPDEREKTLLGELWARNTGNLFITAQKMRHGIDVSGQLRSALQSPS